MLVLHFVELRFGIATPVNTSYIRKKVSEALDKPLASNHFLVSLRRLSELGYLSFESNGARVINAAAHINESMWSLTTLGRQYAETLHSESLRRKRTYTKRQSTAS
ncbi:hypothetical protein [Vibrio agarivorans]|uniref:hypothetical protein n=1 Tax=Vibrio agarivorans TaxID=153622 RepID=UPI0025B369CA|nr:hypothetical protein [Vibrio agarivorans]MDN3661155.1 hypothetical protein [Vibrio agarivorans]